MIRLNLYISEKHKKILESIKKENGVPVSEQVRRAIEKYIQEKKDEYYNRRNME